MWRQITQNCEYRIIYIIIVIIIIAIMIIHYYYYGCYYSNNCKKTASICMVFVSCNKALFGWGWLDWAEVTLDPGRAGWLLSWGLMGRPTKSLEDFWSSLDEAPRLRLCSVVAVNRTVITEIHDQTKTLILTTERIAVFNNPNNMGGGCWRWPIGL